MLKTGIKIYNTLRNVVTKVYHILGLKKYETPKGRKEVIENVDAITLALFKQSHGIATKKSLFKIVAPRCSYKTLVVSINRTLELLKKARRTTEHDDLRRFLEVPGREHSALMRNGHFSPSRYRQIWMLKQLCGPKPHAFPLLSESFVVSTVVHVPPVVPVIQRRVAQVGSVRGWNNHRDSFGLRLQAQIFNVQVHAVEVHGIESQAGVPAKEDRRGVER